MTKNIVMILFFVFCTACENPWRSETTVHTDKEDTSTPPPNLPPGNEGGNGGSDIGLEFIDASHRAIREIEDNLSLFKEVTPSQIRAALASASVMVVDVPLVVTFNEMQQESVAQNIPERKLILINRFRWMSLPTSRLQEGIALHELLGIMGIEGTGAYTISGRYMEKFHLSSFDLTLNDSRKEMLVSCTDFKRSQYTISGVGLSDLIVKIVPIEADEKERMKSFLKNVGFEDYDAATELSFRLSTYICFFDVRDPSHIDCNGLNEISSRSILVDITTAAGEVKQHWFTNFNFSIYRLESEAIKNMPEELRSSVHSFVFGSEGVNLMLLKASSADPSRIPEANPTLVSLPLSFDSRTCR